MNQDYPNFRSRVARITDARRDRVRGEFILRDDGLLVPRTRGSMRFGFPFKGLILSFILAVLVKAYLIWFLGAELYQAEVLELLSGTTLERAAGHVLLPDGLSMWVVTQYEWIAAYIAETRG